MTRLRLLAFFASLALAATPALAQNAVIGFATTHLSVKEGQSTSLTVIRGGNLGATVSARVKGGDCYCIQPVDAVLTFAPNQTSATVNVATINDALYEEFPRNVPFSLTILSAGTSAGESTMTVHVTEDEAIPTMTVEDAIVSEALGTARFYLRLSGPFSWNESFAYSLSSITATLGSDFTQPSEPLRVVTLFRGQTGTIIEVAIVRDSDFEPDETFGITVHPYNSTIPIARGSAIGTIVNDDIGTLDAPSRIQLGSAVLVRIKLPLVSASAETITIASSAPSTIAVPSSVLLPAGGNSASFRAEALAPGSATISVTMPASLGGGTLSTTMVVFDGSLPRFIPGDVTVPLDQSVEVAVSMEPARSEALTIALLVPPGVDGPRTVTIPPGGAAPVNLRGTIKGHYVVKATPPLDLGDVAGTLSVTVTDPLPVPTLTKVAPNSGPTAGGTNVTISGTFLSADCAVRFGGVPASARTFVNNTTMNAIAPPHGPGTVPVAITCGTLQATLTNAFTYLPVAPQVTAVLPTFGSAEGGTLVRLTGANFLSSCGVTFGGRSARVTYESISSLLAVVPPHADGRVAAAVQCPAGAATLDDAFTFSSSADPLATIGAIAPLEAAPGQPVTLGGTRFRPDDRIFFGDLPAVVVATTPDTHVAVVPEMPAGPVAITLRDATGREATVGPIFAVRVADAPLIGAVTPRRAMPGAELTITGSGFRQALPFVLGTVPLPFLSVTSEQAVVRVPADISAGEYPLSAGGIVGSTVTIVASGLSITSMEPRCGASEGGTSVLLHGTGFTTATRVTIDGSPAATTFVDPTSLRITTPGGLVGPARLVLTHEGALATITDVFRYTSPYQPDTACGRARSVRH